jgi:hypothetical protein
MQDREAPFLDSLTPHNLASLSAIPAQIQAHPPRTLGIGIRYGPEGVRFLMSEVPLYTGRGEGKCESVFAVERDTCP